MKRYIKYWKLALAAILVFYVVFAVMDRRVRKAVATGINTQLPQAVSGRELLNKKLQYEAAERDSVRKAQFERQDPYRRDTGAISRPAVVSSSRALPTTIAPLSRPAMAIGPAAPTDPRAEQVLEQLRRLQQSMSAPRAPLPGLVRSYTPARPRVDLAPDTTGDARVGQLNSMLDKVIRIQHPEEGRAVRGVVADEVLPADSGVNTIAAVVASDQTLTTGTTVALRIVDSIRVNGVLLPAGQLVYGTVTINNDRMLVHVGSLREDRSLFVTDLQVYDLDGIAGIHIPGVLSRDVAKQSADQGVSSLNVLEADPSLGAQAANAGIQTVKTFVGRKVKQIRVSVRAGYQVLLRDGHPASARDRRAAVAVVMPDSGAAVSPLPPAIVPDGPVIAHCRAEGVRLRLRGLWLAEGRLWFGLEWENRGAIGFRVEYARWFIRDRRQVRRTAMQELPLEPLSGSGPEGVTADSVVHSWTAFAPFALARDKELVLEVAEKGGARVLELVIKHQELLKAKSYVGETGNGEETKGGRSL